jgi:hypothetical protein
MFGQKVTVKYEGCPKICKKCFWYHKDGISCKKRSWYENVHQFKDDNPGLPTAWFEFQDVNKEETRDENQDGNCNGVSGVNGNADSTGPEMSSYIEIEDQNQIQDEDEDKYEYSTEDQDSDQDLGQDQEQEKDYDTTTNTDFKLWNEDANEENESIMDNDLTDDEILLFLRENELKGKIHDLA